MQLISALVVVGLASASPRSAEMSPAFRPLERAAVGVVDRQLHYQACDVTYGQGYINCVSEAHCYNPGMGQVCCSNGWHCDAGTYCIDGFRCCPDGYSLSKCQATASLSVIAPPATGEASMSTSPPKAAPTPAPNATITTTTPLPTHVTTAGAGKNGEFGVLAAIGGLGALLLAV
ncbi:hypothetical protein BGZ61DRAFT_486035 [Ilyonectria robusta]|uniref:uncharacterized protein n=1 Tax=Ilyonectria robusta TaxID=1079257 RepID=UPI001E8D123D|nr:uncharacterized protein BGZ61DRAFT_486035 [Ilyonectria robusta]KAH8659027.1 hypothetical protein BGZ61DRAFT_486035 [Ilyonectria robusta]